MAIGCELVQIQGGAERVIAYGSFALSPEQTRYCTTRKELLAVVRFARQYRHYLLGKRVLVRTDHNSLTWLLNFKEPQGQLARWIEELSQYDLEIQYRKGSKHANADALARIPQPGTCKYYKHWAILEGLPCGGCQKCTRAHENWFEFATDVDDVIPLTAWRSFTRNRDPSISQCALLYKSSIKDGKVTDSSLTAGGHFQSKAEAFDPSINNGRGINSSLTAGDQSESKAEVLKLPFQMER